MLPLFMLLGGGMNGGAAAQNGAGGTDYGGMMKTLSESGGNPMEMMMNMMGNNNPQMRQLLTMMQAFQAMGRGNASGGATPTAAAQNAPDKKPIAELRPIKHIAPDRIHNSMDEYLRKTKRWK